MAGGGGGPGRATQLPHASRPPWGRWGLSKPPTRVQWSSASLLLQIWPGGAGWVSACTQGGDGQSPRRPPRLCDICSHAGAEPLASGGVSTGRQSCPWSCHPGQRFPTPKSNRDPRTLATPNGGVFDTLSRRGLVADGRLGGSEDCSETPSRDPTLTREVPWSPCEATGSVAGKALCPGACACSSVCSCASDLCDTEGRVRCSVSGACLCVQKQ